jgi:crotonobetainyl-CoA:carnitine CoA-transferase CaiB-like acyl-CoA transferase
LSPSSEKSAVFAEILIPDDEWCAIAIASDAQWRALRCALGKPSWAASAELDGAEGRRRNRALVDRELAAFTRCLEPRDLMDPAPGRRRARRHGAARS